MSLSIADPFAGYDAGPYFCELAPERGGDGGAIARVRAAISAIGLDALRARAAAAENDLINLGITFTVYRRRVRSIAFCRSTAFRAW